MSCAVTAASSAVPPLFIIFAAASEAYLLAVTTIAFEGSDASTIGIKINENTNNIL